MKHVLRVVFAVVSVVALAMMLFIAAPVSAHASTGDSGPTGGSSNANQSHPSATIHNPRHLSSITPQEASGCNEYMNGSKSGTTMRGTLNVTCVGGTVYWSYNNVYSEHCIQSIAGVCWAGWNQTNSLPECEAHNIATLTCGPYLREAASGQLWRWRAETCIQFLPSDVAECSEETSQVQF